MKTKILTIAFLVIGMITNAQNYNKSWSKRDNPKYAFIAGGFDVRNLVDGSKPTKGRAELDYTVKIGAVANAIEVSLFYENFHAIEFQAYGVNVNYVLPVGQKFDLVGGIELGSIIRYKNFNFLMAGVNGEVRYNIGRKWMVGARGNIRARTDNWKEGQSVPLTKSGELGVYYKL